MCRRYVNWIFVILFSIVTYIVTVVTCAPRCFYDDDWGIANYFIGVLGSEFATPYNKFINFILGWGMYFLYHFFPHPNWFIIIQEVIVILSFALLHYMLITKIKTYLSIVQTYLFTSIILITFESSYICHLQFTQTAILGSIVGIYWIFFSYKQQSYLGMSIGVCIATLSAFFRFGGFKICLPFIGLYLLDQIIIKMKKDFSLKRFISCIKEDKKLYLCLLVMVIVIHITAKINISIYNSEYYANYNSFNKARASVVDYSKIPYKNIAHQLQDLGMSQNDYELMISWTFADSSFFTTELFKKVNAITTQSNIKKNYLDEVGIYLKKLKDLTIIYNKLFYWVLIISLICLIIDFKHMLFYIPILLIGTIILEIYFTVFLLRYPNYVRTGVLFCSLITVIMITDFSKIYMFLKNIYINVILMSIFLYLGFLMGNAYYLQNISKDEQNPDGIAMYEYMNARKNDIFMIQTTFKGFPSLQKSYSIFEAPKSGIMNHIVSLGGWSTNYPLFNKAYSSWGIKYPMSQTSDDNVYICAPLDKVKKLQQYLYEHKNLHTTISLNTIQYGTTIYKITNTDMKVQTKNFATIKSSFVDYDSKYNTYNLLFNIKFYGDLTGHYRTYIVLENKDGKLGYYISFNGNDVVLNNGIHTLSVRIPTTTINSHETYKARIMIQDSDTNYLNKDDYVHITLPNKK